VESAAARRVVSERGGAAIDGRLLAAVSRSFALSLRMLPRPMRRPVTLAYLLARASDTLADTVEVPVERRLEVFDGFVARLEGAAESADLDAFREHQTHAGERSLLGMVDRLFGALGELPEEERRLVREVIATIVGGQRLDLKRTRGGFWQARDDAELEDYCWRVAGCVGVFWTRVGFATLGPGFSRADPAALELGGRSYGIGLQLLNILRDLPRDVAAGRCYLPRVDSRDREALQVAIAEWRGRVGGRLRAGRTYAAALRGRRLRAASLLPALIGEETLERLREADWPALERGVKVDRACVRRCLWRAWWS